MVLRLEGGVSGHKFEDGDPQSPDINQLVIAASFKHFWSTIVRSTGKSEHFPFDSPLGKFLADAEINEDDAVPRLVVEHILRFDVSVAYFMGVDVC